MEAHLQEHPRNISRRPNRVLPRQREVQSAGKYRFEAHFSQLCGGPGSKSLGAMDFSWNELSDALQKKGIKILVSEIFRISNFAKIDTFSVFAPEGAVRFGLRSGVYEVEDTLTSILYNSLFYFDPLEPRSRRLKFWRQDFRNDPIHYSHSFIFVYIEWRVTTENWFWSALARMSFPKLTQSDDNVCW